MSTIKILIIDDNMVFRDDLEGQLNNQEKGSAITAKPDIETVKDLIDNDASITDLLIDYFLSSKCKAPDFITKLNIDKKKIRIWFVTGKHTLGNNVFVTNNNNKETILQIRKDYEYIKYIFLKPVTIDEILWRIRQEAQEDEFEDEKYPFLKHFPLPIRIINLKSKSIPFHNDKWEWDHSHPVPEILPHELKQAEREFSYYDFHSGELIVKNCRLHSFELKAKELRAEFCEPLLPPNRDLDQVKIKIFERMKEKGFVRGRFYKLIKSENFDINQPQSYLELCKIEPKKANLTNNLYHPLDGFLKQRISSIANSEPQIRQTDDEVESDEGVNFWNKKVNTSGLKSFLELPIFVNEEIRGLMMFDRMGSRRIDDSESSEVPESVIKRNKVFFKRIIEDAEHFLEQDLNRKCTKLTDKIDPLLEKLINKEPEEQALLKQVLDEAVQIITADGGYFVNSDGKNLSMLEVRATSGKSQGLLQGARIPSDKKHSLIAKSFREKKNIIIQNYQKMPEFYLGNINLHPNLECTFQSMFYEEKPKKEIKQLIKWVTNDIHSIACFPLVYRGTVYGIFEIHSKKEYFFDEFRVNAFTIYFQRIMGLLGVVRLHETMQNWQGSAIAHEIRNDSGPILQTLDNIKSLKLHPELVELHKRIENHTQNIRILAENFFVLNPEYKPPEDKGFSNQFECFQQYLALKSEDIKDYEIQIEFTQIANSNESVWKQNLQGDDASFRRVIRVLLDNAIHSASKELQKKVCISIKHNFEYFEVLIENSGKLDDKDENHLFDAFYRENNQGHKGMHIGLAASLKTVDQLGGYLHISNTLDKRFVKATLKWPLIQKQRENGRY